MDEISAVFILSLPFYSVLLSRSLQEMLFTLSALAAYSPESNQFSFSFCMDVMFLGGYCYVRVCVCRFMMLMTVEE